MDPILQRALEPVLRDLRSSGIARPRLEDRDWAGQPDLLCAVLHSADGTAIGVSASRSDHEVDRVVAVTDQVQEWAIEELWGHAPTNWPPCPHHSDTHPLRASSRVGVGVWVCPSDHTPFGAIGQL